MDVLKDILDNLNDSIIIIDGYGQIVLYNNEAVRIQKTISEKQLGIGAYFADMADDAHRTRVNEILKTVRRQKKAVRNFAEHNTPFDTQVFLELNYIPVLGEKKEIRYINVVMQDVTSRKLFEKKARAAAADVSRFIDQAYALIISVDSCGYVVDWNRHSAVVTGFSRNEVLSQKFSDVLINPSDRSPFDALMASVLRDEPIEKCTLLLKTKTGGQITVAVSATPRTNALGQVIGATLVGHDITEYIAYRRYFEEQLERHKTPDSGHVLTNEKEAVERLLILQVPHRALRS